MSRYLISSLQKTSTSNYNGLSSFPHFPDAWPQLLSNQNLMPFFSPCTTSWNGIDVSQLCKKPELVSIVLKKEESLHVCCSGHHCHHASCGSWMLLSFHGSSGYSASGVNNSSTQTLAHSNHSTIFEQKTLKINSPCSGHKHSEFFKIWFGQ